MYTPLFARGDKPCYQHFEPCTQLTSLRDVRLKRIFTFCGLRQNSYQEYTPVGTNKNCKSDWWV